MIECPHCGCTEFGLEMAGPHIKAICKACGERFKTQQGASTYMFISATDDTQKQLATDKQVAFVKSLIKEKATRLSKQLACNIITELK